MLKHFLFLLCLLSSFTAQASTIKKIAPDFFITQVGGTESLDSRSQTVFNTFESSISLGCKERIASLICERSEADRKNETCQPAQPQHVKRFQKLYDTFPGFLQEMFCHINHIYIEDEFYASAYATVEENKVTGISKGAIGIRKTLVDSNFSYGEWATWKEQLNFGGDRTDYTFSYNLPHYISNPGQEGMDDFMMIVIAHEFGHLFDFFNGYNAFDTCADSGPGEKFCPSKEGSWSAMSWRGTREYKNDKGEDAGEMIVRSDRDFDHRAELCFYECEGKSVAPEAITSLYQGLNASNFMTAYGATNPWDDLADAFAISVFARFSAGSVKFEIPGGETYSAIAKARLSGPFAEKAAYIANRIIFNPHLYYEGKNEQTMHR